MPHEAYASAWRFRAFADTTSQPAQLRCPACPDFQGGRVLDQQEFVAHVHGCTRIPSGQNRTKAARVLNKRIVTIVEDSASPDATAEHEPRGYQHYECSKCKFSSTWGGDVKREVADHDKRCSSKLYRSGVDIELVLEKLRYLVDTTIAHLVCESWYRASIATAVNSKIAKKYHHYVEELRLVSAEEFVAAVAHSTGGLDKSFHDLLGKIGRATGLEYADLVEDVRHTVMWGVGASIAAAFRCTMRRRGG